MLGKEVEFSVLLSEKIRCLRGEKSWKLSELSEKCQLSVPLLSDIERSRVNPTIDQLGALALAFEMTIHDLLEDVTFEEGVVVQPLPRGLDDLLSDPVMGADVTPEWVRRLTRMELRGKRPQTKDQWYCLFKALAGA